MSGQRERDFVEMEGDAGVVLIDFTEGPLARFVHQVEYFQHRAVKVAKWVAVWGFSLEGNQAPAATGKVDEHGGDNPAECQVDEVTQRGLLPDHAQGFGEKHHRSDNQRQNRGAARRPD